MKAVRPACAVGGGPLHQGPNDKEVFGRYALLHADYFVIQSDDWQAGIHAAPRDRPGSASHSRPPAVHPGAVCAVGGGWGKFGGSGAQSARCPRAKWLRSCQNMPVVRASCRFGVAAPSGFEPENGGFARRCAALLGRRQRCPGPDSELVWCRLSRRGSRQAERRVHPARSVDRGRS
jgi:hypothetical protein